MKIKIILCLILSFSSCIGDYTVSGTIYDESGQTVSDAKCIYGLSKDSGEIFYSDKDGRYSVSYTYDLLAGDCPILQIYKSGYIPYTYDTDEDYVYIII